MSKIFISHSSLDNTKALGLAQWLDQNGWSGEYFLDIDPNPRGGLLPGERWQAALKAAADRCEVVLFLISPAWRDSNWGSAEFLLAKLLGKIIFGVIIESTPIDSLPREMTVEWQLCDLVMGEERQHFHVSQPGVPPTDVSFSGMGLAKLKQGLLKAGLDPSVFPWPPPKEPDRSPYRGLKALEKEDAAVFFGREAPLIRALGTLRRMKNTGEQFFVLQGASGAGKSSFLRAGLWPRLARADRDFLPLSVVRPERAAISGQSGLLKSLEEAFCRYEGGKTRASLRETLAKPNGFVELLAEVQSLAQKRLGLGADPPTIVIGVDQAEELLGKEGGEEAEHLLDLLGSLLGQASGNRPRAPISVILLAAIRSDSYGQLQTAAPLIGIPQTPFNLPPLALAEYKMVIEGPASRVTDAGRKLTIEADLTEQLLQDAEGADALPLLAFILERLQREYGTGGELLLKDYQALGGLQGSIEAAVNKAWNDPDQDPIIPADEATRSALLHQVFPLLVTIDQDTEKPRTLVATWSTVPAEVHPLLVRLENVHLLTKERRMMADGQEAVVVEVTHAALLRQWGILTTWLKLEGVNLNLADSVRRAAADWHKAQCAKKPKLESWLIHSGEKLEDAERLLSRRDYGGRLGPNGPAYLVACRKRIQDARERVKKARTQSVARLTRIAKEQRRTKVLQWIIACFLVGTGVGIAMLARGVQEQTSHVLVSDAQLVSARGWYDQALRFEILAMQNTGLLAQAEQRTVEAVLARESYLSPQVRQMEGHDRPVEMVASFSPDQHRVVSASDTVAWVWDIATGAVLAKLSHDDRVEAAPFSPDGQKVVTASGTAAQVWNVATKGKPVTLPHDDKVVAVTFSRDGQKVVTASEDKTARVWNVETGVRLATLSHANKVAAATFSPDGQRVVTVSWDQMVRVWDVGAEKMLRALPHDAKVRAAEFSQNGQRVLTVSWDGTARVWDVTTWKKLVDFRHETEVEAATISPDGQKVVTVSGTAAQVWDVATRAKREALFHDDKVKTVAFSPDGQKVVTASEDKTARVWNAATGTELAKLRHDDRVVAAMFSSDGWEVVTVSEHHIARVWEVVTGKMLKIMKHDAKVKAVSFSQDGQLLVTVSEDKTARLWKVATGTELVAVLPHDDLVVAAMFSLDGQKVVTASQDKTARVWNAAKGEELAQLPHDDLVEAATISRDGQRVVTASADKTARVWDAATKTVLSSLDHKDRLVAAIFSPDGKQVMTASGTAVQVWAASTGTVRTTLPHGEKVAAAMFSSDGKQVVTASGTIAQVWDVAANKTPKTLHHSDKVLAAIFSPDGQQVVTASGTVAQVWNAATETELARLPHNSKVKAVTFSSNGKLVTTVSEDKTVRVWDVVTGKELAPLMHDAQVVAAIFSPDGKQVVTAAEDKTTHVWDIQGLRYHGQELIERACSEKLEGARLVTKDDTEVSPILRGRVGEDVCAPQGWFPRLFFY
jgi:WD40 repeat protein